MRLEELRFETVLTCYRNPEAQFHKKTAARRLPGDCPGKSLCRGSARGIVGGLVGGLPGLSNRETAVSLPSSRAFPRQVPRNCTLHSSISESPRSSPSSIFVEFDSRGFCSWLAGSQNYASKNILSINSCCFLCKNVSF